jgi:tripartite-type tricarboxylate transporter receptor subunit TctC
LAVKGLLLSVLVAVGASIAADNALAANSAYPNKPVRLISPFAPGGGTDLVARTIGQKLSESFGQPVIVDNRPGAGGTTGADIVAKAPADGYTLLLGGPAPLTVAPHLYGKLPYEPLKDLAPVTLMAVAPSIVAVHPSVPAHSVKELLALAKAKPGQLTFSSSGNGGSGHLAGELLKMMAGVDMLHVPSKGTGPATIALLSGEINISIANPMSLLPHIKAGRIRALAVTSEKRSPALPDLPTVAETVPGYTARVWYSILVPARTPAAIVARLNGEIIRILRTAEMKEQFGREGGEVIGSTPEELRAFLLADSARWARVIQQAKIKVE